MRSSLPQGQRITAAAAGSVGLPQGASGIQPSSLPEGEHVAIEDADAGVEAWLNEGGASAVEQHGDSRRRPRPPAA